MINRVPRRALACALLATTALCYSVVAQADAPAPSFVDTIDDHGVDLATGLPYFSIEEGGIGSGPGRIAIHRIWSERAGFLDNWTGGLYDLTTGGVTKKYIQFAGISDTFSGSGTSWTSDKAQGSTLTYDAPQAQWVYTQRDGTVVRFDDSQNERTRACPGVAGLNCKPALSITRPDGMKFTFTWDTADICVDLPGEPCGREYVYHRLLQISSSAGYSAAFAYQSDTATAQMSQDDPWFIRSGVTFGNSANPPSPVPTISYAYPSSTEVDVTDPAGRTWVFTLDASGRITGVKRPGSGSNNVSYGYGTDGTVDSSTKDGVTNSYSRSIVGSTATETRTDPLTHQRAVASDVTVGRPSSDKDELNRSTGYTYDSNNRVTRITAPEGNYVQYGYDGRGNVQTTTLVPKSGSGLSNIVTSASFDTTCSNIVKCNEPNSTTDAKGNVTDYAYDPTHGGVTSITQPAPATGGIRPQTRFAYTQVTSASGDLVYMLSGVSACQTLASCIGAADETKVTAGYNSNLLATSVTRANGTGSLTSASTMTFDARGNLLTVDGPLSGTADTTAYKYDSADQLTGVISPDPDGVGSLKNRAIRLTYRPDSQVSKEELGTTTSQSDAAFSGMTVSETVDVTFDSNSRPTQQKLSASGTAYALTQSDYDSLGLINCTAVRMNTAVYGSLPASACSLSTQGSFGPDQISQNVYDSASELTQAKVGVATGDAATERTLTYSNNGLVSSLLDGENNLTTYVYDGFDRRSKIQYPNTTKGSGTSSSSDYEQLGYDSNSNVTSRRLRDATSIAFTYDNLSRLTLKDLPGSEPDVSYGYDNLGRLTSASQTGNALSFGYDALSRKTSETGAQGTTSFGYDAADQRTSITYPNTTALTINYAYLTTGELDTIKQATTVLADYSYDNLGNRTGVTFGNGASQAFSYDPVSRLSQLTNSLADTNDLTATFSYSPAGQITQTVRTGDMYAFAGHGSGSTGYTQNGLNQQVTIGGVSAGWDSKGNLTSEPQTGKTYGYSSENLLTSASGSVTLAYDPAMRLYQIVGASTTRFLYDGLNAVAEYNSSNALQRRFVFDPTTDEAVVWYEGTGTASTDRRYLSQDERGSVISVSSSAGTSLSINTYDEYGKSGGSNIGRFQYTGQKWIGDANLYDYKARHYLPQLGIFAEADPIGQYDSANLYPYVQADPVDLVDPLGLQDQPPIVVEGQGPIVVTGQKCPKNWTCYDPSSTPAPIDNEIVVTGHSLAGSSDAMKPSPSSGADDDSDIVITGARINLAGGQKSGRGSGQNVRETWLQGKTPDELQKMLENEPDAARRLKIIRQQKALKIIRNKQKGKTRGPGIRFWEWFIITPVIDSYTRAWVCQNSDSISGSCEV